MIDGAALRPADPSAPPPCLRQGLAAAVEASVSGIVICDSNRPDHPIVFANPAFLAMTGYGEAEVIGRNCRFLQGAETDRAALRRIRAALEARTEIRIELLNYRKNREPFWNDLVIRPILDPAGTLTGYVGIQTDVSWKHRTDRDGPRSQQRIAGLIDGIEGFTYRRLLRTDGSIDYPYCSAALGRLLELPEHVPVTRETILGHIHPADVDQSFRSVMRSAETLTPLEMELRLVTESGRERWIRSRSTPSRLKNGDVLWQGIGIDITAEMQAEARLAYLAYHDPFTGLANRPFFETAIGEAVAAAPRGRPGFALFTIDIAGFQEIANILGRMGSEEILLQTAERLGRLAGDGSITARVGEDVFALLVPEIGTAEAALGRAEAIAGELAEPIMLGDAEYKIETCIGIVLFPDPNQRAGGSLERNSAAELMKRCDIALYEAKRCGRNTQCLYTSDIDDRNRNRMQLRQSLHRAVERDEFELNYQPVVDLVSGRIIAAEALVRWRHPQLGVLRPDQFIPLAEETGSIVQLGTWVLEATLRQFRDWQRQHLPIGRIAVNVSGVQLQRPGFVEVLCQACERLGVAPAVLELELTEGVMIERSPRVLGVMHELRALGCGLTVDDFGTGYSSFQYLRDFPVDKIKIDQTFVRNMVLDSSDASLIRAMIEMARSLHLDVVAEGIETPVQCDFLVAQGCASGQGFMFSRPLDAEAFGRLLVQDRPLRGPARPAGNPGDPGTDPGVTP